MIVIANVDDPSDFIVGDSVPMDWEEEVEPKFAEIHAINRNLPYHHFMSATRRVNFSFLLYKNNVEDKIKWLKDKCLATRTGIKHPTVRINWLSNTTMSHFDMNAIYYITKVRFIDSIIGMSDEENVTRQVVRVNVDLSQVSETNIENF